MPEAAILGGMFCRTHSGAAPQVKRKAAERLADLIDPDRHRGKPRAWPIHMSGTSWTLRLAGSSPFGDWSDDIAPAVASIEVTTRNLEAGDGKQEDVVKIRLWDKSKSLELLFKHLGMLKDPVAVEGDWGKWAARLASARNREEKTCRSRSRLNTSATVICTACRSEP